MNSLKLLGLLFCVLTVALAMMLIADGPTVPPPYSVLVADGPTVPPPYSVLVADGPTVPPPYSVLIADGPSVPPPPPTPPQMGLVA